MPDKQQLTQLKAGVDVWNEWRRQNASGVRVTFLREKLG
jgi:hypothetical protein